MQVELEAQARTPGVVRPIYKKGDPTDPANYRPITLGSAVDKLYHLVLNARLLGHLEATGGIHEAQNGFRAKRGAVDNIFMLRACVDARLKAKLDTFLLFLDIEKAYDTVWRGGLLWHLWRKGVRGRFFRVLANMTDDTEFMVLQGGALSEPFHPDLGWEQGDTLATTMFNVFVDGVLEQVWEECRGISLPGVHPDGVGRLVALMYADGFVGFAASEAELQALADSTRAALQRWRLKASVSVEDASKTAVMRIGSAASSGQHQQQAVRWGPNGVVPWVNSYRYLGVQVTSDGKWEEHLTRRTGVADAGAHCQYRVMADRTLPARLRKLVLTAVVQPALTYAAQAWVRPTKQMRQRLDSWQMGWVGRAFHCPATATQVCLQQELGLVPMHVWCDTLAMRYWHHIMTLPANRLLAAVAHAAVTAWRGPWQQAVDKLLQQYAVDAGAALAMSHDAFAQHCARKSMAYLRRHWSTPPRGGQVAQRYIDAFGVGCVGGGRAHVRQWLLNLTEAPMSAHLARGVDACMQLRAECLPLRVMHHTARRNETAAARQQRELCPCCRLSPETPAHFLLECSATAAPRRELFAALQVAGAESPVTGRAVGHQDMASPGEPLLLAHFVAQEAVVAGTWRRLLGAGYLEHKTLGRDVAAYVSTAWATRRAALTGRGANGGNPMALAPGSG
jgi:hypothetical protein